MILQKKLAICLLAAIFVSLVLSLLLSAHFLESQSKRTSDLFYSEQKPFSEIVIVKIDDKSINEIGRWPWPRDLYADALGKLDGAKVVGIDVSFFESAEGDDKLESAINDNVILVSECNKFSESACSGSTCPRLNCTGWLKPVINATTAAANIYSDNEIARAVPYEISGMKSLSVLASEKYLNKNLDVEDRIIVNYAESFDSISFSDLLKTNATFDGKIVLIGATAKDLHDEKLTPMSKVIPGVEIHANAIQTILTKKFLSYQSSFGVIITIFIFAILTALLFYFFRIVYAIIGMILMPLAYLAIGVISFEKGIIMNWLYPMLSLLLTFAAIIIVYYLTEARQRKMISDLFGKYVSQSVADELIKKGKDAVHLEGVRKEVTVLFADVRGFTSMSEKMQPEQVVSLLNQYHGKMTDIIFQHNGTLDKYVGDEIMATYNVPLDMKDHALAAVKTAIEMQKESKKLGKNMVYGIGINTGSAVVGNIGSERRLDYTVIGDSINLGARLCSKAEGHQILISESTNELVRNIIKTRSIGEIQVKGKEKALKVYEVVY